MFGLFQVSAAHAKCLPSAETEGLGEALVEMQPSRFHVETIYTLRGRIKQSAQVHPADMRVVREQRLPGRSRSKHGVISQVGF